MSQVIVYSSNMCSACEMVKEFLKLRGVEYIEKNVSTDLAGRAELIEMGYDSTPVTVIGSRQVPGFKVAEMDEAIAELNG